ncbi:hypothetical protein, partial [Salmonella sp. s51228]|uniref:hypothetical protein n=1 Tax=Salmonella sp. s51228 TaxID=3159652 RepID=UPI003980285B
KNINVHSQANLKTDSAKNITNWTTFTLILHNSSTYIWSGVSLALDKYLYQLKKRNQLIEKNNSKQIQNNELKMLVQQYLIAQVNRELIIPPTHSLQITNAT